MVPSHGTTGSASASEVVSASPVVTSADRHRLPVDPEAAAVTNAAGPIIVSPVLDFRHPHMLNG